MTEGATGAPEVERGANVGGHSAPAGGVDLVITTCEGREHLLVRTLRSFEDACPYPFARRILALDGQVAHDTIAACRPDIVVQRWRRSGYVASILTLLPQVAGGFFFWLEDDWTFNRQVDLAGMCQAMVANPRWMQIRLSKVAPLSPEERAVPLGGGFYRSASGFSANPSLNRTREVQAAFAYVERSWQSASQGFEVGVTRWATEAGAECVVADPGEAPPIAHEGYLESTPRHWHMTTSLAAGTARTVFSLGTPPGPLRRVVMVLRLLRRFATLAARQLWSLSAYEVAFRVVTLPLPRDERE